MEFLTNLYNKILSLLNKDDRQDDLTQTLTNAVSTWLNFFQTKIQNTYYNFFFDKLTVDGCKYFEELMNITPSESQTLDDRRSTIWAKWLSNSHNCIELIQRVCNAWKRGEVVADFVNGKIKITFVGSYGVPDDLDTLKVAIGEIKPAHIGYEIILKYLLIKDIHEVKTIEEMEALTLKQFAFGVE